MGVGPIIPSRFPSKLEDCLSIATPVNGARMPGTTAKRTETDLQRRKIAFQRFHDGHPWGVFRHGKKKKCMFESMAVGSPDVHCGCLGRKERPGKSHHSCPALCMGPEANTAVFGGRGLGGGGGVGGGVGLEEGSEPLPLGPRTRHRRALRFVRSYQIAE